MSKVFIDTTLVDGFADGPHITEEQVGIANQGLYGPNDYVLDEGKKSKAEILTNNSIRIFDATYVIQGRRDVIAANDYTDVNIDNGSQGMNRNDIIVRRYEKDESSEIEKTSYAVIKGTPTSGTASDPEVTTGVIRNGDTLHEMKLYRVKLNGLNIVAVEPLFDVLMSMSTLNKSLSEQSLKGKSVQTGNYGKQWKINQTDYYSIFGKELLNQDSELYTTRESKITVKKPGTYLAILHAYTFSTSGGGTLWARVTVNSSEKQTGAARCQGYGGIDLHCLLTLNANDTVDGQLSATGDITSEGKDTLTLIKL